MAGSSNRNLPQPARHDRLAIAAAYVLLGRSFCQGAGTI